MYLCNHCCSGQAVRITYPECVSVGLGIQHAVLMHHIGYLWPVRLCSIFLHYLINGTIFFKKKKLLAVKCVFWFYLQLFFWNICHSRKNWLRYDQKFILFFMYSSHYFCQILTKLGLYFDIFVKNIRTSHFMKIHPVGTEFFHADGQTWWSFFF